LLKLPGNAADKKLYPSVNYPPLFTRTSLFVHLNFFWREQQIKHHQLQEMQTKALILVIFLFCHPAVKADVNPTIQAVCKVNLRNGTIAEGFILLGSGNYEGIWMNGFNLETRQGGQRHDKQFFFDLDFRYILCTDSTIECAMKENNSLSRYLKVDKMNITFLLWKRNPSDYDSIKYSSVDHSIKFIRHSEREYLLLDSLTIYQDLTSGTFIDSVDNFQKPPKRIKGSKIAVKDVGRFEILANPENAWLDKIESAEKSYSEMNNDPDSSGDGREAEWFHKILTDKGTYNLYQSTILRSLEKKD